MSIWTRWTNRVRSVELEHKAKRGQPTEICEAEWRAAIDVARIEAYQVGLAEGEIRGRMGLASEIESAFGDGPIEITADHAARIRHRQLH